MPVKVASQMHRSYRLALLGFLCLATSPALAEAADSETPLLRGLGIVERDHSALCKATGPQIDLTTSVEHLAEQAHEALAPGSSAVATIAALNHLVFGALGIQGSPNLKDPCNLLPSGVLGRKQGYCVGIAALYLLLAERLNLPIFAVATPSHVFLRYDDGTSRINIETLQQGANVSDEMYIREQTIPGESLRRGVFMRNMITDEFLAQVHNNLAVIYSERKAFEKAAMEYELALSLDRRLPAAWYNRGNDLLRQGDARRAVRHFSKSLRLYATDVWALNNRGLAYLETGRREKARRDFESAIHLDPQFAPARRSLESLLAGEASPGSR